MHTVELLTKVAKLLEAREEKEKEKQICKAKKLDLQTSRPSHAPSEKTGQARATLERTIHD